MKIQRRKLLALGAASSVGTVLPSVFAQTFPDRPITIVVPFPPGGNNDVVARTIAEPMARILGQNIIVDNRAGGGGAVGATYVASAKPDGLTLLVCPPGQLGTLPHMIKTAYRVDSFRPIGLANKTSMVLVTKKNDPRFRNLKEFIEYSRSRPGAVNFGHGGPGTPNHLAILQLEEAAKCKYTIVAYKGSAPMLQDLLGGQVDAVMDQITSSRPFFEGGQLQPLAVIGTAPDAGMPSIPTLREVGLKEFDSTTYVGLVAPAGTPDSVVATLASALKRSLDDPKVIATFAKVGSSTYAGDAKEFAGQISREDQLAEKMVKEGNLKSE